MSGAAIAWAIVVFGFLVPLGHVALSPRSGPWRPPAGARCPLGPRAGWVVLVLFLGPIGWLLYLRARGRRAHGGPGQPGTGSRGSAPPGAQRATESNTLSRDRFRGS